MKKITVKLKTGTSQQEAEMLIKTSGSAFPEADIEVIYSDDPTLSIVVREVAERATTATPVVVDIENSDFNPHANPNGGNYGRD